jgi:hypothetical protein
LDNYLRRRVPSIKLLSPLIPTHLGFQNLVFPRQQLQSVETSLLSAQFRQQSVSIVDLRFQGFDTAQELAFQLRFLGFLRQECNGCGGSTPVHPFSTVPWLSISKDVRSRQSTRHI